MTDNLTTQTTVSTVPSGSIIATDDAGAGGHVQVVKLAISTDGSATALTADNTDGLLVNLGTNNDVTLATLPDTAAGDLAAINTATVATQAAVEGTLTVGSHAVTNAGTFVVQEDGAALTALQLIDDIVHVDDTATHATGTTKGAGIMAAATPTDGSIDANDIGMLAMSTDRRLHVDSQIVGQDADVTIADGGNSITVDGTITELNSTAILADTASMDTNLGTLAGAVAGTEMQIDIVSDGAGLATSANQLADGHNVTVDNAAGASAVNIQDGGNTITVDNGGTFATQATLQANSGVDIGDVDVTSVIPGTGATNLGKAADSVAGATDTGVAPLAIRDDSLSALTPVEGDYVPLRVNSTGALHVTGAGGGTQYTVSDAGPTVVTMAGAVRDDSLTTLTEVDGDATLLRVNSTGALHVTGGGGGTEYTEDVATANPIVGTATLIERDDALTTITPVEGDWIGLRGSAEGALWTQDFNSDAILADTTAILADTASIDTNMATVAGAVAGTEMQVDIVSGNVTNAGTFVVQEDGAALTALQLLDDVVATLGTTTYLEATTKGNIIGAVRNDTLAALADTDNEIAPLQVNATGALYIQEGAAMDVSAATVTVDGSGVTQPVSGTITETNSAAILADTASIDTNMATVAGAVAAGQMQVDIVADGAGLATAANQLADGHNVTIDNAAAGAAVNIQDGGNSITIDGTVTANLSATDNAVLDQIELNTSYGDNTGNGVAAGSLRVTVASDTTGVLSVDDNGGSLTVDNGGTFAVQAASAGDVAHDGADSGNPVKLGYKAIAHGTNPTAVAASDRTDAYANRAGIPWVIGGHPNVKTAEYHATGAQTNDDILGAISAGTKYVVTGITATIDNATSVDVGVRVGFGATTVPTEPADGASVTGVILAHDGIAPGSGVSRGDGSGILGIGGDGLELRITNEVPTSGSLKVIVTYYTIES